jgi:sulfur relay (sulfurtransferase) DsrF/TusC family protein
LRPGLAQIVPIEVLDDSKLRNAFDQIDQVIDRWIEKRKVPA